MTLLDGLRALDSQLNADEIDKELIGAVVRAAHNLVEVATEVSDRIGGDRMIEVALGSEIYEVAFDDDGDPVRCPHCGSVTGGWTYSDGHEPVPDFRGWKCNDCGGRVHADVEAEGG
jgi:hypothetical protein